VIDLSTSGLTFKLNERLITAMSRAATKSGRKTARRRPGRPDGAAHRETVRADLLRAARVLFAKRDFTATSVREIARRGEPSHDPLSLRRQGWSGRRCRKPSVGAEVRNLIAAVAA
jgi:hypothetical protein